MPQQPPTSAEVRDRLHQVAESLRQADHLDRETQAALAELVEELSRVVEPSALPSAEVSHLADSAAHLAQVLRQPHDATLLEAAKNRLDQAALRAQQQAPLATGLVRRVLDALANLGI